MVVTHLEMRKRADLRPAPGETGAALRRVKAPGIDWYRKIFRAVGGDWFWFSRLTLPDDELAAILENPDVGIWTLSKAGKDLALLELHFHKPDACELSFFGLSPDLIGHGAGRQLMNAAIEIAWSRPIRRFHLTTCTLDSPDALAFYMRSGFTPIRQEVEIAPDPRLTGVLPEGSGMMPILRGKHDLD